MGLEFGRITSVEMNGVDLTPYLRRNTYAVMRRRALIFRWNVRLLRDGHVVAKADRWCALRWSVERLGQEWIAAEVGD